MHLFLLQSSSQVSSGTLFQGPVSFCHSPGGTRFMQCNLYLLEIMWMEGGEGPDLILNTFLV